MRVHGGTDHRPGDYCSTGLGCRSCSGQLLVDGVPEEAEDQRSSAPSARIPEPLVREPGHALRADSRVLEIENSINQSMNQTGINDKHPYL